jgi:hypothetical protein
MASEKSNQKAVIVRAMNRPISKPGDDKPLDSMWAGSPRNPAPIDLRPPPSPPPPPPKK